MRLSKIVLLCLVIVGTELCAAADEVRIKGNPDTVPSSTSDSGFITPLERWGRLHVQDLKLVSETGKPVQLRGVSTHDIAGYDWLLSPDYLDQIVHDFHADVVRLAMYVEHAGTGYVVNPGLAKTIDQLIEDTEKAGIYCIVDWHILSDNNPNKYKALAIEFFSRIAAKYSNKKHLLFEICNEPNGDMVTWEGAIRPYAVEVLAAIRKADPSRVVLVGTPGWSSRIDAPLTSPLNDPNVMYVFHWYAGHSGLGERDLVAKVSKTIPVFNTEWGSTADSGDGPTIPEETFRWLKFLDENGISNCNWSFSNEAEGSAAFRYNFDLDAPLKDNLTPSGRILWDYLHSPKLEY